MPFSYFLIFILPFFSLFFHFLCCCTDFSRSSIMYKTLLFVALCCAALVAVDGAFSNDGDVTSYVAELSNPIYGDFSVVLQVNLQAKTPFASLAGVYNCVEGDNECSWTTFNVYSGSIDQFNTPYFDGEALLGAGWSFAIDSSPINAQVDIDSNFDISILQQGNLFAVLSGSSASTDFVGPFTPFHYFGIAQSVKFAGDQTAVTERKSDITYDSFSGTLQYDNGRAQVSASVSRNSNLNSPYPNVNIAPATFQVWSQYEDADDFDGLLIAEFDFSNNGNKINAEWATSFEAVSGARNGFLNFYVVNSDQSLYLRGQITSYSEDNQDTIQH